MNRFYLKFLLSNTSPCLSHHAFRVFQVSPTVTPVPSKSQCPLCLLSSPPQFLSSPVSLCPQSHQCYSLAACSLKCTCALLASCMPLCATIVPSAPMCSSVSPIHPPPVSPACHCVLLFLPCTLVCHHISSELLCVSVTPIYPHSFQYALQYIRLLRSSSHPQVHPCNLLGCVSPSGYGPSASTHQKAALEAFPAQHLRSAAGVTAKAINTPNAKKCNTFACTGLHGTGCCVFCCSLVQFQPIKMNRLKSHFINCPCRTIRDKNRGFCLNTQCLHQDSSVFCSPNSYHFQSPRLEHI